MKFKTTIGKLLDALTVTAPTLDKKGISANLYLMATEKFLYLYSTNMTSEIATRIVVNEIEIPGEVLVDPGKLKDGLQGLSKESIVNIELVDNNLKVSADNVKLSFAAPTGIKDMARRLQDIPRGQVPADAVIPASELNKFTSRSEFCLPNDETGQKASLSVLKLTTENNSEEAFATDGSIAVHIVSTKKQGKGEGLKTGLLIPTSSLQALRTILSKRKDGETIDIILTKNKVFFRCADGTHMGAMIAATPYPNIRPITSQNTQYMIDVPRDLFKQSLNRASSALAWSITNKKTIELEFDVDKLLLKINGSDNLSDTIDISYKNGKPTTAIRVGMNINYLINIVSTSTSENITIGFTSEDKPLIVIDKIEPDSDEQIDVKYIVMGVRLANGQSKQALNKIPDKINGN